MQNSYATILERGASVDDQRNRFVAAFVGEPKRFQLSQKFLNTLLNNWELSSIVTVGSGRPVNATTAGDANRDGNGYNDRLPGYKRNAFLGPDYFTTDLRITRTVQCTPRAQLQFLAESFNVFNRTNSQVQVADDGFYNSAGQFVAYSANVKQKTYPRQFQLNSNFMTATNAYAPRQLQFAVKLTF